MINDFLYYFFQLSLINTLILFTGTLILSIFKIKFTKSEKYHFLFVSFFVGISFWVICTSIYYAGITINWILIIIGVGFFYKKDIKKFKQQNRDNNFLLYKYINPALILVFTLIFSYIFFNIYQNNNSLSKFNLPHGDVVFYSSISYYLQAGGEENIFGIYNHLDNKYHGVVPYHYFELWLNVWISKIAGGLYIVNFLLLTTSSLIFGIFLGFLAIWEKLGKISTLVIIVAFLFLGISGITFPLFKIVPFFRDIDTFSINPILFLPWKIAVYFLVFQISILFLISKQRFLSIFSLLMLPIFTFASFPSIIASLLLLSVLGYITEFFNKKEAIFLFLSTMVIAMMILGFYKTFGNKSNLFDLDVYEIVFGLFNIENLRTRVNIILGSVIQVLVAYILPLLLLLIFYNQKVVIYAKTFYPYFVVWFFALATWAALFDIDINAWQLFFYISYAILNLLFSLLLIKLYNQLTNVKQQVLVLLFIVSLSFFNFFKYYKSSFIVEKGSLHSESYLFKVKKLISTKSKIIRFGFIKAHYSSVYHKSTVIIGLGTYLSLMKNYPYPISLSDLVIPRSKDKIAYQQEDKLIKAGALYNYARQYGKNKSKEKIQWDFIKKYNIKFIVVDSEVILSKHIKDNIKEEIKDKNTGERFILLK